ncbi:MAG TPA: LLM class flavin-dependent oxidoreductase [Chloroflexota bacterium]|nr:LLM class flavin-dependent oxidoreductase [Chloroflexota bacterium]
MRIAINMPLKDAAGVPLDTAGIMARARSVEAAGISGIWMGDGLSPGMTRPDPLMWLLVAAAATTQIEVGTSIYQIPLRHPVELGQRLLTLQALTRGRFTVGVGAGSTKNNHDSVGVDFEQRFRLLRDNMDTLRRLCDGETVGLANLNPWPEVKGGPRFVVGAWHNGVWLKRAAEEYDGWMSSAGRTNFLTMADAIKRYRDMGGKRAIVSTCLVDLTAPTSKLADDESFHLRCGPEEASERLHRVAELGYDDILLVKADHTRRAPLYEPDYTPDDLAAIRALLPRDDRPPYPNWPTTVAAPVAV